MPNATRPPDASLDGFAVDVHAGLSAPRKTLPSRYFYDALGSQLFDAICELPWYPITRAENLLLERYAPSMVEPLAELTTLVELGCGSGDKIAVLAAAAVARAPEAGLRAHLVDVSQKALDLTQRALAGLPRVAVVAHRATYEAGLRQALEDRPARGSALVLFLGSNLGNFDAAGAEALLREVGGAMRPGDALLVGADLVKPTADLLAAYDDPLGVTAAFNKNVLVRANRELGADFDLAAWDHRAVWNEAASRIEMHLVSARRQTVSAPAARLVASFEAGETIWTESSYKYTPGRLAELGARAGLLGKAQWIEPEHRFASTLFGLDRPPR